MKIFMSKMFRTSILSSIGLACLGLLLFFESELTIVSISYVIGGLLIALGVLSILKFIGNLKNNVKNELDVVYGCVTIILGIVVISNPKAIASIIPFIIGVLMILSSAMKLGYSFELKKEKNERWTSTLVLSIITLLFGILLVFNPFQGAEFISKIIGALIFSYAVLDLISTLSIRRTMKQIKNAIEDGIAEADVVEDNTKEK